jgi:hypothetical protein
MISKPWRVRHRQRSLQAEGTRQDLSVRHLLPHELALSQLHAWTNASGPGDPRSVSSSGAVREHMSTNSPAADPAKISAQ